MNPKLSVLASVAEIVSGVAVVVTLVFLTISLRDNTNTTRTLVYQQLLGSLNQQNTVVLQDGELATLWESRRELDFNDLSTQQRAQLAMMFRVNFRTFDAAYYASQYETLGESERARFERASCGGYRQMPDELRERITGVVSDEFQAFLASSCD